MWCGGGGWECAHLSYPENWRLTQLVGVQVKHGEVKRQVLALLPDLAWIPLAASSARAVV